MDPKSLVGKPPKLEALEPDFASRLSAWIAGDMRRAKQAREAARRTEEARAPSEEPPPGERRRGEPGRG